MTTAAHGTVPVSQSREERVNAFTNKLQELIDNARAECADRYPKIRPRGIRVRWIFKDFPKFPTSQYNGASPLPDDISAWPDWYISKCYPFPDGKIEAEAFIIHVSRLGAAIPHRYDSDQPTKSSLYTYVRGRLRRAIETTIGREIYQRSTNPTNFCVSDLKPPNLYRWVFSTEYPVFPAALSNMDRDQLYDCIEALEMGHIRVECVESKPLDARAIASLQKVDNIAKRGQKELWIATQDSLLKHIEEITGKREDADDLPEVIKGCSQILDKWQWQFSREYSMFHISDKRPQKRDYLSKWAVQNLKDLLYALDLGHVKLVPRPQDQMSADETVDLKPRRSDLVRVSRTNVIKLDSDNSESESCIDETQDSRSVHESSSDSEEYSNSITVQADPSARPNGNKGTCNSRDMKRSPGSRGPRIKRNDSDLKTTFLRAAESAVDDILHHANDRLHDLEIISNAQSSQLSKLGKYAQMTEDEIEDLVAHAQKQPNLQAMIESLEYENAALQRDNESLRKDNDRNSVLIDTLIARQRELETEKQKPRETKSTGAQSYGRRTQSTDYSVPDDPPPAEKKVDEAAAKQQQLTESQESYQDSLYEDSSTVSTIHDHPRPPRFFDTSRSNNPPRDNPPREASAARTNSMDRPAITSNNSSGRRSPTLTVIQTLNDQQPRKRNFYEFGEPAGAEKRCRMG